MTFALADNDIAHAASAIMDYFVERIELTPSSEDLLEIDESTARRFSVHPKDFHPAEGYAQFLLGEAYLVFVPEQVIEDPLNDYTVFILAHRHNTSDYPTNELGVRVAVSCLDMLPHAIQRRNDRRVDIMTPRIITTLAPTPEA